MLFGAARCLGLAASELIHPVKTEMSHNCACTWTPRQFGTWFQRFWLAGLWFLSIDAGLAHQPEPASTNALAELTLEQLVNILITPPYRDKLFSGFQLQYYRSARTLAGTRIDDFGILNWTRFSKSLSRAWSFPQASTICRIQNAPTLGSADHLQDAIPQDGRGFGVKLTYKFWAC